MKSTNNKPMYNCPKVKTLYHAPRIERIELDNAISLVLESEPPIGPNESTLMSPDYFNSNPFKAQLG